MGIIDKLTGHSSSSSSKHSNTDTTAPAFGNESTLGGSSSSGYTGAHATPGSVGTASNSGLTSNTSGERHKGVGEKAKEAVGLDPKYNDPKDAAYQNQGTGYSSNQGTSGLSSQGTSGYDESQRKKGLGEKAKEAVGLDPKYNNPKDAGYSNTSSSSTTTERGLDRQTERMGGLGLGSSGSSSTTTRSTRDPMDTTGHTEVHTAAPVVAEHVHDEYTEIDSTRVEELHDRTQVKQTVQPVRDERTEALTRDRVDHGLEVHEHGQAGLDARTKAELAAKREKLALETRSTHDERTVETSNRPNVDVQERTNYVEEVVPVVEKDIYRPHETEHHKRVVNIHHEAPVLAGTKVNAPVSLREWESQGHSISGASRTRTGSSSSSSSSSSSDNEGTGRTGTTRRKKGLGEKVKEAVGLDPKDGRDPKDAGYSNTSSGVGSSGIGSSSTADTSGSYGGLQPRSMGSTSDGTSFGQDGQRHKGVGEKAKEAVGLDPKYNDPKDAGYSNTSGTSSSGVGSGAGYSQSGTSGTGAQKGVGEKVKEQLGIDKDPRTNQ